MSQINLNHQIYSIGSPDFQMTIDSSMLEMGTIGMDGFHESKFEISPKRIKKNKKIQS